MNELFSLLYLQTSTKKRNTGCDKEGGVSLFGVLFHVLLFKCWSCFVAFLSDFASFFPTEPGSYLLFANLLHLAYGCSFSYLTYLYLLISKICSFGTLVLVSYIWVLSSLLKKGKKTKKHLTWTWNTFLLPVKLLIKHGHHPEREFTVLKSKQKHV